MPKLLERVLNNQIKEIQKKIDKGSRNNMSSEQLNDLGVAIREVMIVKDSMNQERAILQDHIQQASQSVKDIFATSIKDIMENISKTQELYKL